MATGDEDQPPDEVEVPAGCVDVTVGRLLWQHINDISVLTRDVMFRVLEHTTMCSACFEETLRRYIELSHRHRSKAERDEDEAAET